MGFHCILSPPRSIFFKEIRPGKYHNKRVSNLHESKRERETDRKTDINTYRDRGSERETETDRHTESERERERSK